MFVAKFTEATTYGTVRYYPANKFAAFLVILKRQIANKSRRRVIKCLSKKELSIVQKMGIVTEVVVIK